MIWMDLEGAMLPEIHQAERDEDCMISFYMWNLNKSGTPRRKEHMGVEELRNVMRVVTEHRPPAYKRTSRTCRRCTGSDCTNTSTVYA